MAGLAAIIWGVIIVRAWAPAAKRRGGHWALEAILIICGPIMTATVAMYPPDTASDSIFPTINRAAALVVVALAVLVLGASFKKPRQHAGWLLFAVVTFYAALGLSTFAGVVPAFPEAYLTTPIVILAFLVYGGYTSAWLLRTAQVVLRIILLLSFAAIFLMPDIAFNLEESRTVFGINRLQGIVAHPNGFAALAVLGFLLELHGRSRLVWKVLFLGAVVVAQSSTGVIALIIALLVMTNAFSKFVRVFLYLGGVVVLLAALFGFGEWLVATFVPEQAATLTGRTAIWAAALYGFQLSPIFGYGPTLLSADYRGLYLQNFEAAGQAHNQWVQTLGGEGMVGAASLVILALVLIMAAAHTKHSTSGLSVALVAFLVIRCVTETPLRPSGPGAGVLTLIVIFGLLATSLSELGPKEPPQPKQAPRPDWANPRQGAVKTGALL
jgi:O-antigen ligase